MKHVPNFRDEIHGAKIHLPNNHGDGEAVREFYIQEVLEKLQSGKYAYNPRRDLADLYSPVSEQDKAIIIERLSAVQSAYVTFVFQSHDHASLHANQQALETHLNAFAEKCHETRPHHIQCLVPDLEANRLLTYTLKAANAAIEAVCPTHHGKHHR